MRYLLSHRLRKLKCSFSIRPVPHHCIADATQGSNATADKIKRHVCQYAILIVQVRWSVPCIMLWAYTHMSENLLPNASDRSAEPVEVTLSVLLRTVHLHRD